MFSSAFQFIVEWPAAQRALIAGLAVAAACSLLSVFVVLKRMAFIGQGISHAGYGAAGTALFLGLVSSDPRYDALVLAFCIATAWLIGFIARRRRLNEDTAIGILLAGAMAWGVFITNFSAALQKPGGPFYWQWYAANIAAGAGRADFDSILFGALLNITFVQAVISVVVAIAIIMLLMMYFKEIVFFAFDEPTSQVYGVRTGMIHYLLLTLLAVTVVLTMRLAGVLLVGAILVIPGATALMLSDRLTRVLAISCGVGLLGVVLGLLISLEWAFVGPGPCIVGVLCLMFVLASGWRWMRVGVRRAA
ncbi:MAG: metal ABC transporter permease [Phycisphaeraceae bacterium]